MSTYRLDLVFLETPDDAFAAADFERDDCGRKCFLWLADPGANHGISRGGPPTSGQGVR
jgi:hypothetical protein